LADCRAAAEAEGRDVVAQCSNESASAYKGDRGPGLERAMAHADRAGAELWVQHSDRLARGDGKRAPQAAT
jgi:Resolvase, N terminal domain